MENISVNGIDITDLVMSFEYYEELVQDVIIGNAVSTQIKLKLKNKDNELDGMLDYPFLIGNKTYEVYQKPEKWTKIISITLYDQMINSNINYDSKLDYTNEVTISAQLDEIASILDLEIDKTTLSAEVLNKTVKWYDNSEIIRYYLGCIAECDGKNAFIENDKIVFKTLSSNIHIIDYSSGYDLNELTTIGRVCLETGVGEPLSKGGSIGKTLYLNSANSYLTQQDVDRIYELYNGLSFYSFKSFKCRTDGYLQLTDIVKYHDIIIMPLSIKRIVNGGQAKDTLELSGDLTLQAVATVQVEKNVAASVKRIKTIVDQNEAQLKIVAEQSASNDRKIAELQLTTDGFKVATEKVEELEKKVGVTYWIESSLGYMLDESVEEIVILTAHFYIDEVEQDIEEKLYYNWYSVDYEGNETHIGKGKSVEVYTSAIGGRNVYFIATEEDGETFYFTDEKGNVFTDEEGNVFTYQ